MIYTLNAALIWKQEVGDNLAVCVLKLKTGISIYLVPQSDKIEEKNIDFCHNTFSVLENIVTGIINHKN